VTLPIVLSTGDGVERLEVTMTDGESRRDQIRDKVMGIEGKWVFGRVMPQDLLEGISRYLKRAAPEREKELLDQIRSRAENCLTRTMTWPWTDRLKASSRWHRWYWRPSRSYGPCSRAMTSARSPTSDGL
jgi:hypothetical protein